MRVDFRDVREFAELLACIIVQGARFSFCRGIRRRRLSWPTKIALRCNEYGVEQAGTREALRGQGLQPDTQRQHRHQGSYTDGNAKRGERIPKHSFAQIANGEFAQVSCFQRCAPSLTRRPSESCAMRFANLSARGRSWVTMMMVIPRES